MKTSRAIKVVSIGNVSQYSQITTHVFAKEGVLEIVGLTIDDNQQKSLGLAKLVVVDSYNNNYFVYSKYYSLHVQLSKTLSTPEY